MGEIASREGLVGYVAGILLDLGVSSPQLDDPQRGFSFSRNGPLDMRMDPAVGVSAAQWLAHADEKEIAGVLRELGEERFARRIARAIVLARRQSAIDTTGRLAEIVVASVPTREPGKHPATRSFQAIRIFINRELEELKAALAQALSLLMPAGRLVVISFHSLEDRIVKRFMRDQARGEQWPLDLPVPVARGGAMMRIIGKAVRPRTSEVQTNPRSRSAIMRVAERLS
jgi:16S rRNA (cytosine1402-N4)-methyltransferase